MIILASSSPRRSKILKDAGVNFKVLVSDIDEKAIDVSNLKPEEMVMKIAKHKALAVSNTHPKDIVIGADTGVFFNSKFYGKPENAEDAVRMLSELSGNKHEVITGVAVIKGENTKLFYSKSIVYIRKLGEIEILDYVKTGEPLDKAGAYAIQGMGGTLVEKYEGDFFNIVGLPLKEVLNTIEEYKKA